MASAIQQVRTFSIGHAANTRQQGREQLSKPWQADSDGSGRSQRPRRRGVIGHYQVQQEIEGVDADWSPPARTDEVDVPAAAVAPRTGEPANAEEVAIVTKPPQLLAHKFAQVGIMPHDRR